MHRVSVRPEIIARVLARRGRVDWFDRLDPARTALVVIDMQTAFCAPGAPAEVPLAREIVPAINALTGALRKLGCPVIWVLHANTSRSGRSDWSLFFDHVVGEAVRERTMAALAPGQQTVWSDLDVSPEDHTVIKNRYSALIAGSSQLERLLRSLDIDTVLIAGTKTNVCCEVDSPRRHDARLQDRDAVRLLRGPVRRRAPRRAGKYLPAIRRCPDGGRGAAQACRIREHMTDLAQLIDVVRQHGEVAYAFIFAYAASHAMLMALFAGYAAQLGVLDLKLTLIHCFAGSFIGDVVRFWIARRYGDGLLARWPRISAHAVTVKRLVDRHALWLPLIHRFPYGIRGLGAFAYGLSKMSWGLFLVLNVIGSAIWAVSMVLAGYAFGTVSDKVLGDAVSGLSIASLVVFLAISWMLSRKLEQAIEADARRNP